MGDTTEEQYIPRFHGWFVDLRQIDTRVQIPRDGEARLVASRHADEATTVLTKPRRFVLQCPGYVDLLHKLTAIEQGMATWILSV